MKRSLYPLLLGLTGSVGFLAFYIVSAAQGTGGEYYSYGQKTYLVMAILFLFVAIFGGHWLCKETRNEKLNEKEVPAVLAIEGIIGFSYFLGSAIKDGLDGENVWPQIALSIFFFVTLVLGICDLALAVKKSRSSNQ